MVLVLASVSTSWPRSRVSVATSTALLPEGSTSNNVSTSSLLLNRLLTPPRLLADDYTARGGTSSQGGVGSQSASPVAQHFNPNPRVGFQTTAPPLPRTRGALVACLVQRGGNHQGIVKLVGQRRPAGRGLLQPGVDCSRHTEALRAEPRARASERGSPYQHPGWQCLCGPPREKQPAGRIATHLGAALPAESQAPEGRVCRPRGERHQAQRELHVHRLAATEAEETHRAHGRNGGDNSCACHAGSVRAARQKHAGVRVAAMLGTQLSVSVSTAPARACRACRQRLASPLPPVRAPRRGRQPYVQTSASASQPAQPLGAGSAAPVPGSWASARSPQERKRLLLAVVKPPIYTVALVPVLVRVCPVAACL